MKRIYTKPKIRLITDICDMPLMGASDPKEVEFGFDSETGQFSGSSDTGIGQRGEY